MAATKHAQQIKEDSQQYLTTALLQLLQMHDLNEIKVTDLIKRAGVSRMAFYRNYQALEDILHAYFAPQIEEIFEDVIRQVPSEEKLRDMAAFFSDFSADLALAATRNYEYIIQQIFTDNMARYYAQGSEWEDLDATKRRYWVTFMSAGVYGIWREWLLHGQEESLDDIHILIGTLQNATAGALKEAGSIHNHS
ncbi:TetR/AcrR family transcriptional regulator [Lacticaseibacillus mingshuiensis]|uniref:TetR/AcrR family transcriptional regulator n=1 Tax=Lacticaseibacillus mingshuiensis TaxID=2799574 RepID=A0ABW4CKJ0_9LACO|nr:TetR/AcrR family transcriptional regulator [Lacticaseibacillus mingshuiensis]